MRKNISLKNYLKTIYGVGDHKAEKFATHIGASISSNYQSLSLQKKGALNKIIAHYKKSKDNDAIFKNLQTFKTQQINRKIELNTLSGRRHKLKLPTRGQRTRCNAKNARKKSF
jgi:small subunit ribosomal protein S13